MSDGNSSVLKADEGAINPIDPIHLMRGVLSNPGDNLLNLTAITLKGAREKSLKEDLLSAIVAISQQGEKKIALLSSEQAYNLYDDLESLLSQIDKSIGIEKFQALKKLFTKLLTEDDIERVYTRKLMSCITDLTVDEILVLRVLRDSEVEDVRKQSIQENFLMVIAQKSGLKHKLFIQPIVEGLVVKNIMNSGYMGSMTNALTGWGEDVAHFLDN